MGCALSFEHDRDAAFVEVEVLRLLFVLVVLFPFGGASWMRANARGKKVFLNGSECLTRGSENNALSALWYPNERTVYLADCEPKLSRAGKGIES